MWKPENQFIVYSGHDDKTRVCCLELNLLCLIAETDAPFMTPRNLPNCGKVCHPGMALCVASTVANHRQDGASVEEIIRRTTTNVSKVYKLAPLL